MNATAQSPTISIVTLAIWLSFNALADSLQSEQRVAVPEEAVKAAFLYRIGGFVEWPAESFGAEVGEFRIGVVDAEVLADRLEEIVSGRKISGRDVVVVRLTSDLRFDDIHLLFIGHRIGQWPQRLIDDNKSSPVLIVSESPNALANGSMINFVLEGNKVRFDIAPDTAIRAGLRISANLLAVARTVEGT